MGLCTARTAMSDQSEALKARRKTFGPRRHAICRQLALEEIARYTSAVSLQIANSVAANYPSACRAGPKPKFPIAHQHRAEEADE